MRMEEISVRPRLGPSAGFSLVLQSMLRSRRREILVQGGGLVIASKAATPLLLAGVLAPLFTGLGQAAFGRQLAELCLGLWGALARLVRSRDWRLGMASANAAVGHPPWFLD